MASSHVHAYLRRIGQKGGQQRAKNLSGRALSAQARKAIIYRWIDKRFGVDNFKSLALPGAEIVDLGLMDLINGNLLSINALAVIELRPKLRFLGVPIPDIGHPASNVREQLFQTLEAEHGDMAYVRFCALLERLDSFCDSLAAIKTIAKQTSHRNRRWCA